MSSDRPPPRRRLSAAQRRERILGAAQEVFAQRGYHGSSLDDIAKASGTSKALIYEHFESKRELHETLVTGHASELARRFAANAATGMVGEERLRAGVDVFFGWVQERREAWQALFRDAADPELAPLIDRLQAQATRAIVALVPAGGEGVDEQQIEMYAQLTSGACQALANWWADHTEVSRGVLVDRVMEVVWDGMSSLDPAGRPPAPDGR
ncbi:HTH-type transcriptional repressor BepR [Baekduia alba]|uniref:TetR/AcrR family transcriptional regulator n=1 Tax=Baekduia alba TaxID=2997333 RepID=UPI00233F9357|nr:TetR/AcrR family transcriptional regulator [Baekduia alba]WCB94290.1 HTH-type transcriptional repressor BepR [Baekduia alba]